MTQSPITVTYSLEEILARIEGKIDKLDEKLEGKINKLDEKLEGKIDKLDEKVDKLTVELTAMTTKIEAIDKRLEKVEGTQKNQIWTLITLLGGSLIAVGFRSFFTGNTP
jgi:predicted nuclease with TOPRIM domain